MNLKIGRLHISVWVEEKEEPIPAEVMNEALNDLSLDEKVKAQIMEGLYGKR